MLVTCYRKKMFSRGKKCNFDSEINAQSLLNDFFIGFLINQQKTEEK